MKELLFVALAGSLLFGYATAADIEATSAKLIDARLYKEAQEQLLRVQESDPEYAVAQRLLGKAYADGRGVEQDYGRALGYFREAAKNGDYEAMYLIGVAYEEGLGVAISGDSAYTWYDRAANESPMAALRYAEIALANQGRAGFVSRHDPVECLRFAAEHGLPRAMYLISQLALANEIDGMDEEEALQLLHASSVEVAEANTALGQREHQAGRTAKAKEYLELALSMGDNTAAAHLGYYAEHGIEQSIDRKKAWDYYKQAEHVEWAKTGLERLKRNADSIELLGLRVSGTPRKELWQHFGSLGLPLLANEEHWDAFNASSRMEGRQVVVTVAYTPTLPEYVAEVSYRFMGEDRRDARAIYQEVLESLTKKYGDVTHTHRKDGKKRLSWRVGESSIELSHKNKESVVFVTYQLRPYSTQLRTFLTKNNPKGDMSDAL